MLRRTFLALSWLMIAGLAGAADQEDPPEILAPGWGKLDYEAPPSGTYQLPPITEAANGRVLREDGSEAQLLDLMGDRLVLFSFIYTKCSDLNGCPLANSVFHRVQAYLRKHPQLAAATRMLSISFDPENDTPEVMKEFGKGLGGGGVQWEFLTTQDRATLQPILDDYGQYTLREYDETGAYTGEIAHMLRVFLIDRDLRVRNIYSVSFLHPDILVNDLETLLQELSSR